MIPKPHLMEADIDKIVTEGAIKEINSVHFLNVLILLKLPATLTIASCQSGRYFSTMRQKELLLYNSIDTEWFGVLALINAFYDYQVRYTRASDPCFQLLFARKLKKYMILFKTQRMLLILFFSEYIKCSFEIRVKFNE